MNANAIRMLPLAALLVSGITGCGGSTSKSSTSSSTASVGTTGAASAPSATASASSATGSSTNPTPASAAGLAAPGAKLAVGKSAVVAYQAASDFSDKPTKQRLQVTVNSIVKGSLADFKGIKLDAAQRAGIPFYVKVRIKNVGPGDISARDNDPSVEIEGIDSTGQAQQGVSFIGDFPRCNETGPPTPMTRGKGFDTCITFLVPGGITAAAYTGTSDYVSSPVTWR
jgi:hypothetical protein